MSTSYDSLDLPNKIKTLAAVLSDSGPHAKPARIVDVDSAVLLVLQNAADENRKLKRAGGGQR